MNVIDMTFEQKLFIVSMIAAAADVNENSKAYANGMISGYLLALEIIKPEEVVDAVIAEEVLRFVLNDVIESYNNEILMKQACKGRA